MTSISEVVMQLFSEDSYESDLAFNSLSEFIDGGGVIEIDTQTIAAIKSRIRNREGHIDNTFAIFISSLPDEGECFLEEMVYHLNRWSSDINSTQTVLWTLGKLGQRSISAKYAIASCLNHSDAWVRYYAIHVLCEVDCDSDFTLDSISSTLKHEIEPFVVFTCIFFLLTSKKNKSFLQLCKTMIDKFYDKMNASHQQMIDALICRT